MRHSFTSARADTATGERLRDILARAATPADSLRAELAAPSRDFTALIGLLSRQIDETVLPRRFALVSAAGTEASFVVSNRRLIELEIAGRKIAFDSDAHADADSVARTCARALKALSLRSGPMHLRLVDRAPKVATQGTTCTARHIAGFSAATGFENRMKSFLKATHARSLGWLYRAEDGQAVRHAPDAAVIDILARLDRTVADQAEDRRAARRVERGGPSCTTFAIADDCHALVAEQGKDRIVAAFPADGITAAIAAWHRIFQRSDA